MNAIKILIGIIVGGSFGYGLYKFIGCSSGACPITSNLGLSKKIKIIIQDFWTIPRDFENLWSYFRIIYCTNVN